MTVLRTARLLLRPPSPADAEAVHAIVSEREVVRWTASWPWPPERGFTEGRMAGKPPEEGLIACVEREGAVIGLASVVQRELGYMLAPWAWGRGYATEACRALLEHAFATTGWPGVEAGVFRGNDASLRVLGKLGFRVLRDDRTFCRALGREAEGVVLGLDRADWAPRA